MLFLSQIWIPTRSQLVFKKMTYHTLKARDGIFNK